MRKRLILFVEGNTDKLFFHKLISRLLENNHQKKLNKEQLIIISLDGIGNAYSQIKMALSIFNNDHHFNNTYALFYDTDVFEYGRKPPINIEKIKDLFYREKNDFFSVGIKRNVEDMIAVSKKEIKIYLHLDVKTKISDVDNGLEYLKKAYSLANSIYIKGYKAEGLINALNYDLIIQNYCNSLRPLCAYFNFDCKKKVCYKKK